jgi:gas vesicle protein
MKKAFYLLLTGVAIGILIAPRKGSETREKLKEALQNWKEEVQDQTNKVDSQGKTVLDNGKASVENMNKESILSENEW